MAFTDMRYNGRVITRVSGGWELRVTVNTDALIDKWMPMANDRDATVVVDGEPVGDECCAVFHAAEYRVLRELIDAAGDGFQQQRS